MIADYLNQTATWKRTVGLNEYGEPITTSQTIKVRWEGKRRLVRDRQGQEVVSEARFFCLEEVQPGDIVEYGGREWPIIAVTEIPDLDGNIIYREVAC
ncbi:hypothetical protein SAMN00808754_1943 [Thermanaeromonas toyohensis ToBE]|uniref:Phage head-tail joining protein n=1 Tax=Thermanaeromonas toyohensis ToBE TaxID=698762 RepID=A0A1W1VWN3_9FIRM|nr:hypothetical protein [Thermanaeromonas toyohensis]SMB97782.1 hypothetical protein SAMN00808754_1943 [Thermanaeromonas toyohensis ToBE]